MDASGFFTKQKHIGRPAITQYDAVLQFSQVPYLAYGIIILTNQNLYIIGKMQILQSR